MPSFSSSVAGRQVFYALIFPLRSNVNNTPFPFVLPRSYFFFWPIHLVLLLLKPNVHFHLSVMPHSIHFLFYAFS